MKKDKDLIEEQKKRIKALESMVKRQREEEGERKNREFVQVYKNQLKGMRRITQEDKNALTVLLILVEKMNKRNAIIISQSNLEKITGKSRTAIQKSLRTLKKHKFIKVMKSGAANIYVVNSQVFWQTDNKTKEKFSTFDATVYATLDEQDDDYRENWDGVKMKYVPVVENIEEMKKRIDTEKEDQLEMFEEEH